MKKKDIVIGGVYSDGKSGMRRVIDFGEQYKLYDTVECTENLRYRVLSSRFKCEIGKERNSTIQAFASWAKRKVDE